MHMIKPGAASTFLNQSKSLNSLLQSMKDKEKSGIQKQVVKSNNIQTITEEKEYLTNVLNESQSLANIK